MLVEDTQEALCASPGRELEVSVFRWPALFLWFVFTPGCWAGLVSSPLVSVSAGFVVAVVLAGFQETRLPLGKQDQPLAEAPNWRGVIKETPVYLFPYV